jgi:EAL domain-containing protein (putative c-di-GMP-specific phosphodiesterase class I)
LVPVAINVSPRQLRDEHLHDRLQHALTLRNLTPHHIEIEITETGLIEPDGELVAQLRRIEGMGVLLAIDDFGTGFSGLTHLRALPF